MLLSTLVLCLLPAAQEPTQAQQRALAADDVAMRFSAAQELAAGDEIAEKWLLREAGKGTEQRQRALLLAASLMGTTACQAVVEKAASRGRKPNPIRAFALLLYGQYHPAAGSEPRKDWDRCASDFERACLLAGLLAHPERLQVDPWPTLVAKRKEPTLEVLLDLSTRLVEAGEPPATDPLAFSAALLASVDPRYPALPGEIFGALPAGGFPDLWWTSAPRFPARAWEDLRRQALVGEQVGLVLTLYEVEKGQQQALFDHFRMRTIGKAESGWLWGAAGDLGLEFPDPEEEALTAHRVGGILRLARRDFPKAVLAAQASLPAARSVFRSRTPFEQRWPAAVLLAIGQEERDLQVLKQAFQAASGVERHRLTPIWKFANRGLGEGALRDHWLDAWSRGLGAGWRGYQDIQGPRWTAYLLAGGSLAAENQAELAARYESLESLPKDYSPDHILYRDLVEFLLSGNYRWRR